MANQTVTTVVNYDDAAISGLLNGETITINGGTVTIDADVRWNQQAAVFGAVTLSASLGGSFLLDGTRIWEVPFSAASGNVPAQLALGSNGVTGGTSGATGELTRVWATGSLTPATAGGAMPASGYIKLRSKTGDFASGEVITLPGGATVTASDAGKRSWVHVVGRGTTTGAGSLLTIPRLGVFEAAGDWYELGTTNGADNQTLQYPVADQCPAIWIETAPASGIYEVWLNAGDRWSNGAVATTDRRGMYFGCVTATGVITLALRGGSNAGLKPPTGCRVRVPNIIMSQANGTAPDYNANILPAGLAYRYGFTTTAAGSVVMDKVSCNWYAAATSAFAINITDSGIGGSILLSNIGTAVNMSNVGIGIVDNVVQNPIGITTCFGGGTLTDVRCARRLSASNGFAFLLADAADFTLTRCRSDVFGAVTTNLPTNTQSCFELVRAINTVMVDCVAIGGIGVDSQPAFGLTITGFRFASRTIGTTQTSDLAAAISTGAGSTDLFVDGFDNFDGIANVHPYANIILTASGMNAVEVRNVGTPAAPYNMGSANACANVINASVTRSVVMRRIYTQNTRTAPFAVANTVQGFEAYNLWGDAADAQANLAINSTIRGGRYTPSVTGQTSVYGTHWQDAWTSTTAGRLVIACNEPTADTADQCTFTLNAAAGSGFTSAGNVSMKTLTDVVTWEMPYYALGVTGFSAVAPTITGTNAANHTFDFQYDLNDGAGFNGTWLTLNSTNMSAITVDPADGVKLKVRATINVANTGNLLTYIRIDTVTNSTAQQTEYPLPVVLNTAQVTNILSGSRIRVYNVTTDTEIANEIVAGTSWTLLYVEGSGFTNGDVLNIRLTRCTGATASLAFQATAIAGATGWALFASQLDDTVYATNAINGALVTEFTPDYPNVQIDINDPDGSSTITRLYAWFANELTTVQGIRTLVGGLLAEDPANYRIIASVLNLKLDNIAATGVQFVGDLRLYRDDGASPVVSATTGGGSIVLFAGKVYTIAVGSGVTPQDKTDIINGVWDATLSAYQDPGSTGEALDAAAAGGGGGGATAEQVWTYGTRTLTANPGPSAADNAAAVRTNLAPELANLDVATSTRAATADARFANLDAAVSSRLATAGYTAPDNASVAAILVDTGTTLPAQIAALPAPLDATATQAAAAAALAAYDAATAADLTPLATAAAVAAIPTTPLLASDTRLNNLDAAISTRLASAGYTAPDNASIAAILTDTGTTLPAQIAALPAPLDATATQAAAAAALTAYDAATGADLTPLATASAVAAIPTTPLLASDARLNNLDATVSSRLATAGYTAPDNASIAAILTDTGATLPAQIAAIPEPLDATETQAAAAAALGAYDTATAADLAGLATASAVAAIPTTPLLASDARLNTLDAAISSRLAAAAYTAPDNASISAILVDTETTLPAQIAALPAPLDAGETQAAAAAALTAYDAATSGDVAAVPAEVRDELAVELARIDVATSTRQSDAIALARAVTINDGVKQASLLIPHTGDVT